MSAISTILTRLRAAIWAIDVRDDIANAIEQCYSDVSNPTLQTEALEAALQNKIDEGEMAALTIGDHTITAAKLAQGVIDNTLATSGAAADAKKTGDELTAIKADLEEKRWSDDAKQALLDCLDKVAWKDESGPVYRETLEALLYGRAPSTIEKIWANGVGLSISGTQEMSVITNTKRGIIYNESGEVPLISTAQTEGAVYPIPIPAGATGVKFHGMQETDYITMNMQILKYENGKWLQVAAAGFAKIVPDVLCRTEIAYRNDGTYYMVGTYGLADATHTNPQESRGNVTIDTSGFEMEVITEPETFFTNSLGLTISNNVPTVATNTKRGLLYQKEGTTPLLSSVQGVNNVYPIHIPQGATGVKFHGMKTSDYISINLQILLYKNDSWNIMLSAGFAKIVPDVLCRTEIASYNNGDYYMIGVYGISDATHTGPQEGTVTIDTTNFTMEVVAE